MSENTDYAFAAIGVGPADDLYHQTGMTLRDWFAGTVAAGLASAQSQDGIWNYSPNAVAGRAYAVADAMLAESKKGGAS